MVDGTLGLALDFDDILHIMPDHLSVTIQSALLSTLHGNTISSQRFLDAPRVGVEVGAKIGIAIARCLHMAATVGVAKYNLDTSSALYSGERA